MIYQMPNGEIVDSMTWVTAAMKIIRADSDYIAGKNLTADETEALWASQGYYFAEDIEDLPDA